LIDNCRLFIVCQPSPPAVPILKDVFSRFGNLIDVYLIGQKTCGYVKYASKESAELAMKVIFLIHFCMPIRLMGRVKCIATGFDAN
jgi:hypothetical protein